jgi:hypothetical protein
MTRLDCRDKFLTADEAFKLNAPMTQICASGRRGDRDLPWACRGSIRKGAKLHLPRCRAPATQARDPGVASPPSTTDRSRLR